MTARTVFRAVAIAEAVSWGGLLAGMLLKYVVSDDPTGVHVFGPIHGAVFVLYCLTVLALFRPFGWSPLVTLVALAPSLPPFGPLVLEESADRAPRRRHSFFFFHSGTSVIYRVFFFGCL